MKRRSASPLLCIAATLAAAIWLLAGGSVPAAEDDVDVAWELRPYRIQALFAIDGDEQLPAHVQSELPVYLKERGAAIVGGTWKLEVAAAPAELAHAIVHDIGSVTQKMLPATAQQFDKVILLGLEAADGGFRIRAREFDVVTGLWNATISSDARQADYLPQAALRAMLTAFAPLARIEKIDGETVTLKLRASALLPRSQKQALASGTVFRPVLLECNAQGTIAPGKAELVDWTYLTAAEISSGIVKCRVQSGLSGDPLPDYHPLRQRWAIGISPTSAATRLRLVSREGGAESLEGLEVLAEETPAAVIGRTDRRGEVSIPSGTQTVRTIVVRHGDEVLARLLLVPGLTSELTVPVSFDRQRVQLDAAWQQLADELLDATARRAVLAALLRAAEEAKQSDEAAKLRQQLTAAANVEPFLASLDRLEQSVQSASADTKRRLKPKVGELRKGIDRLKSPKE